MRASPLARILFLVWVLLAAYATLYPFAGWHDPGLPALGFLSAPWPRYVTAFDVTVNVAGYLPHGFLAVLAVHPRMRGVAALGFAAASGLALSIALETAQGFLPARDASNLDVACNFGGALAGAALGVLLAPRLLESGPWRSLRARWVQPGAAGDVGLALLGLWLFAQLNPATLLFGAGDLRDLLVVPAGRAQPAAVFAWTEAMTAAAHLVALSLLAAELAQRAAPLRLALCLLVAAALGVKTAAFAILMHAEDAFAWLTPGARQGLAAGLVLGLVAVSFGRAARLALAAVLLMGATVLVNLAPPNPYLAAILRVWQQGHFLNFNGLTRLVSTLWPFAALAWLTWIASRKPERLA